MAMKGVYLLHYERPYPGGRFPRHYMGSANDIESRLKLHAGETKNGRRPRFPEVMREAGISFVLARVWETEDHRNEEVRLKSWHVSYSEFCPVCKEEANERRSTALPR